MSAAIAMAFRRSPRRRGRQCRGAPRGGQRVVAAGADADEPVLGLQHVAGAGQHQRRLGVGHRHHGFEPAQVAVGAPVLGELDAGAHQLARILLELALEPLEQGEGVGGGAGEAGDDLAAAEAAHLARIGLDDGLAEADLAVAGDGDRPPLRTARMVVPCHGFQADVPLVVDRGRLALDVFTPAPMYAGRRRRSRAGHFSAPAGGRPGEILVEGQPYRFEMPGSACSCARRQWNARPMRRRSR
jgi:hypothetical protein